MGSLLYLKTRESFVEGMHGRLLLLECLSGWLESVTPSEMALQTPHDIGHQR